ncbi:MAG: alpha-L-fucosidase, partial [Candidatus Sumerlaeota bacterium]
MPEFLCRSHPDFHMPAEVEIGKDFDGDAYARRLKENNADAVVAFAKCHYGHAYYPSKYGTVHPRLCKDMMRETADGCRKHGLGFIAYFSVFLDTCAVREHPDWALQATSEGVDAGFLSGKFLRLCVTSPYLEELFIPQCKEAIEAYQPDEILLDTMSGFQPCYCERCKVKFGHPIPESHEDPNWLEYVAWYRDQFQDFFARVAKELAEVDPKVRVGFNWEWSFRRPADPPEHIGNLMGDLISAGRIASLTCRYYAGVGLPYAYMTGRFLHGLGDWTSNTMTSLVHTAASAMAHGADFWIIDRQLPDGSMQDDAFNAMDEVFGFMQPRKEWVSGARHVSETAALFSYDHVMGPKLEYFPDMEARKDRIMPFEGLNRTFMTTGRHYTALNLTRLLENLEDYRLVILPEVEFLSDEAIERLRAFVENGGRLLFSQADNENGVYPALLEMGGVEFEGFSQQDYGYF